jgi:hypothetical protein
MLVVSFPDVGRCLAKWFHVVNDGTGNVISRRGGLGKNKAGTTLYFLLIFHPILNQDIPVLVNGRRVSKFERVMDHQFQIPMKTKATFFDQHVLIII